MPGVLHHSHIFVNRDPLQWGAADAEIKVPSVENTELKGSPLRKPGVGQYIAVHATLAARDFFLANI